MKRRLLVTLLADDVDWKDLPKSPNGCLDILLEVSEREWALDAQAFAYAFMMPAVSRLQYERPSAEAK